jgi:hypothetical protein
VVCKEEILPEIVDALALMCPALYRPFLQVLRRKILIDICLFIALASICVSLESCLKCAPFDWQIEVLDLRLIGLVSNGVSRG